MEERLAERAASDISVVIPFYNRERYIDDAVQSVLAQTLQPLEIIIVNDCSKESSRSFLERYSKTCRIIDLPVNVGLAGCRNAGIRAARGRFVALLDDDDIWLPRKLEEQRKLLDDQPSCSGVHSAVWLMLPDQEQEYYLRFGSGCMTLAEALTNDRWVIPSTMMFRTEVIRALGGFDPRFRICEDRDLIIRFCAAGYEIEGIPVPLTRLRREGQSSLTSQRWRIFGGDLKTCWKHRRLFVRVYGLRGIVWFVLEKLQEPTFGIRYVYGGVRRLLFFVKARCRIRPDYLEPVGKSKATAPQTCRSIDRATLVGGDGL